LSVAFTKEDSAETASETLLPDRTVSPHPNVVTEAGLKALELQLQQAREAYQTAQTIEDVNERRRQAANPLRDVRYFAARVRTAQVITDPTSTDTVAFGSTVTFKRDDGRVQKYRIVGEDEADPKSGSISFVSPVARLLMGKAVGDVAGTSDHELTHNPPPDATEVGVARICLAVRTAARQVHLGQRTQRSVGVVTVPRHSRLSRGAWRNAESS
jgi:transcription elongation GreA/GreB family factor